MGYVFVFSIYQRSMPADKLEFLKANHSWFVNSRLCEIKRTKGIDMSPMYTLVSTELSLRIKRLYKMSILNTICRRFRILYSYGVKFQHYHNCVALFLWYHTSSATGELVQSNEVKHCSSREWIRKLDTGITFTLLLFWSVYFKIR